MDRNPMFQHLLTNIFWPKIFWKKCWNSIAIPWKWTTECFKSDCGHNLWIEMFFEKNEKSELANSNLGENRWKKMKKVNWQTQTWGKTGEKRWRKWKQLTFADCFFGKQSRSKFGFDLTQGIPDLVVFLTFDAICHQTHFIDGIHVSIFFKEFSSIWAFYSGVCCKSQ